MDIPREVQQKLTLDGELVELMLIGTNSNHILITQKILNEKLSVKEKSKITSHVHYRIFSRYTGEWKFGFKNYHDNLVG